MNTPLEITEMMKLFLKSILFLSLSFYSALPTSESATILMNGYSDRCYIFIHNPAHIYDYNLQLLNKTNQRLINESVIIKISPSLYEKSQWLSVNNKLVAGDFHKH